MKNVPCGFEIPALTGFVTQESQATLNDIWSTAGVAPRVWGSPKIPNQDFDKPLTELKMVHTAANLPLFLY